LIWSPPSPSKPELNIHHAATKMDPKRDDLEISSSSPSLVLQEFVSEKRPEDPASDESESHTVHEPGLATWRLFTIIGG
jgi:hypothetical protein